MKTTSIIKKILFTAAFIALIGLIGQLDYEEAIKILQGFPDDHIESKILVAICFTNVKKYDDNMP